MSVVRQTQKIERDLRALRRRSMRPGFAHYTMTLVLDGYERQGFNMSLEAVVDAIYKDNVDLDNPDKPVYKRWVNFMTWVSDILEKDLVSKCGELWNILVREHQDPNLLDDDEGEILKSSCFDIIFALKKWADTRIVW